MEETNRRKAEKLEQLREERYKLKQQKLQETKKSKLTEDHDEIEKKKKFIVITQQNKKTRNTLNKRPFEKKYKRHPNPLMLTASEKKVKLDEVVRRRLDDKILNKGESPEALFADLLMTSDYEKFFNGGTTYGYLDDDYNIEEPFVVTKTRSIEHEETILSNQYDRYFGEKSRINFHKRYKQQRKDMNRRSNKDITDMPSKLLSPRSMYLREVDKNNLLPLSLLLRKENKPLGLYLGHRGLGDDRLLPVVQVLEKLPALQTIDLSDNRLTDKTLTMFAVKLQELHSLTYLDLSYNKIDESSSVIMDYIIHPRCKLNALILNGADVDDNECGNLAKAISLNKTIQILGLAHNLIGKSEILNVLHPDLITGGEAIGEMLKVNTTLTKLDLSWNAVRLESAIALAESLEVNTTLKTLLLAYNSFGDIPSQVLGRTLKVNKGLTELDIESNSITPKAATVLANSISFNEALLKLNINGNVLGRIGAQALVAAIQRSSTDTRKLQVSFINCDCRMEDDNIFSAACPYGKWKLNLAEPYGQMVAVECLYLANHRAGCKIDRLYYNGELVTLERSFGENDKDSEAKKFKFKEFLNNCNEAAENLINGNIDEASRLLQILLDQFGFTMAPDNREIVLKKTLELWNAKAKRERREVRYCSSLSLLVLVFSH